MYSASLFSSFSFFFFSFFFPSFFYSFSIFATEVGLKIKGFQLDMKIERNAAYGDRKKNKGFGVPTMIKEQEIWSPYMQQFLSTALSQRGPAALPYAKDVKWLIWQHLVALAKSFPSLHPKASAFTHNNGRTVNCDMVWLLERCSQRNLAVW